MLLEQKQEIAAIARAVLNGDKAAETAARQRFAALKISDYIVKTLAVAPPLSEEQREHLAQLLREGAAERD